MNTLTTLVLALALSSVGVTLLAESAQASICVVGHSYYSGCLLCVPPAGSDYCACAPECAPQSSVSLVPDRPADLLPFSLTVTAPGAPAVLP